MARRKSKRLKGQDKSCLKICFWNAGGLTQDKFLELKHIIFQNDFDVVGVVESGAVADNLSLINLTGYQSFSLERSRRIASGIVIFVKNSLISKPLVIHTMSETDKLEVMELQLWRGRETFRLLFAYNPPANKPDLDCVSDRWNNRTLLFGDFNAPSRRWGYKASDSVGHIMEDFIDSGPVEFIENNTKSPTFLSFSGSSSHPDLLLAHTRIAARTTLELLSAPGGAGHKILSATICGLKTKYQELKYPRWNIKKADWTKFQKLTEEKITPNLLVSSVDASWNRIRDAIIDCANKCVPRGQVKKYSPFWSSDLEELKKKREEAKQKAEYTGLLQDCIELRKAQAVFKKAIIQAKRDSYKSFLQNMDFRRDGVKAHKFLSKMNNEKTAVNVPLCYKGKQLNSNTDIVNAFCKHYANVSNFSPKRKLKLSETYPLVTCHDKENYQFLCEPFNRTELEVALISMDKGKSAGPDKIVPEMLFNMGSNAKEVFLALINKTWSNHIPSDWRKATVIPLLKKGKDPSEINSYRLISLTSVACKVAERMIGHRLRCFLEKGKRISVRQAGFQQHRDCVEQVTRLTQEIKDGFHRKQSTLAVFIDFKAAFDRVWRRLLLKKLASIEVAGNMLEWIKSFLAQRFICCRYNDKESKYRQIKQGLPQGSVLSPILFSLMIDDLVNVVTQKLPGVQLLLYADDVVMWATSSDNKALENTMKEALLVLEEWTMQNEMEVNTDKTVFQLFTLSTKPPTINLMYANQQLTKINEATYLGISLDNKLSWINQINKSVDRGLARIKLLKRLAGIKWGASEDVLSMAYKSYVRPAVEYGNALLITAAVNNLKKLDVFQNTALRLITGGAKSTPIQAMELQAEIQPLAQRRERAALLLHERVFRNQSSEFWSHYVVSNNRLKTQSTFLTLINDLYNKYEINIASRLNFLTNSDSLLTLPLAQGRMDLIRGNTVKSSLHQEELRAESLETIHCRFPQEEWLHVYTDGSANNNKNIAGAGVYSELFELQAAISKWSDNFDGEMTAVKMALEKAKELSNRKIVLFVDNQATISVITSPQTCRSLLEAQCKTLVADLISCGKTVCFQWIPGHSGISGNEKADKLAKTGSLCNPPDDPMPFRAAKRLINAAVLRNWNNRYRETGDGKKWYELLEKSNRIPQDLPRHMGVACFRMFTGHDYLQQHLYRIGVKESPICPLCTEDNMTAEHLSGCSALKDVAAPAENKFKYKAFMYWTARNKMINIQYHPGVG